MKTLYTLLSVLLLSSCAQESYYAATNKNMQRFESIVEESTAKYILELNDDIMLMKLIASNTKQLADTEELSQEALELERKLKKMQLDLQLVAAMNNIALTNVLSGENDRAYNDYNEGKDKSMERRFHRMAKSLLQDISENAYIYINDGQNERIQKFSVVIKNRIDGVLASYS